MAKATTDSVQAFIEHQLSIISSDFQVIHLGDRVKITCPTAIHTKRDRDPSRILNLSAELKGGMGHSTCWSCGDKKHWNDFAPYIGLQPISNTLLKRQEAQTGLSTNEWNDLVNGTEEETGVKRRGFRNTDISDSIPWPQHKEWRGVAGELVALLDGRMVYSEKEKDTLLYFPVVAFEHEVGGILCRRKKSKDKSVPSYINSEGVWSRQHLFPYDFVKALLEIHNLDAVVLVEGPRDMLRLLSYGIPALCCIGSKNSWSKKKAQNVLSLDIGTVALAFDGDAAGQGAQELAYTHLSGKVSKLIKVRMGEDMDPAQFKPSQLFALKKRLGIPKDLFFIKSLAQKAA